MSLRELLTTNLKEHLPIHILATVANLLLSVPQYFAVNSALELGVNLKGAENLAILYGSNNGLILDLSISSLIFQAVMAVLMVCVAWSGSSRNGWRWQYVATGVFTSGYLAYYLGGKFLNILGWIGVLETSGVNVSGVYEDLFWFGLGATICSLLSILTLRGSYGKLAIQRETGVVSGI